MSAFLEAWRPGGAQLVALDAERVTLGRAPTSDVVLDDSSVSRLHAVLERYPAGWCVRDLGSSNGTFVNGDRVVGERNLKTGDELHLGGSRVVFRDDHPGDFGATVSAEAPPQLTPRERAILIALCRPLLGEDAFNQPATIRHLAEQFVVTEAAIKFHLLNLYDKFGIYETQGDSRRVQLANAAVLRRAVTISDLRTSHEAQ